MDCRLSPQSTTVRFFASVCLACSAFFIFGCPAGKEENFVVGTQEAAEAVGERLFLETRFAQAFKVFLERGGQVNDLLPAGDPVLDDTTTTDQPLPGPFAGLTMNCRACHLVDEQVSTPGGGMRTYADFARRSPLPQREDGKLMTPRNAPPLVNASLDRPGGLLFHFDAEFATLEDVIAETFTGRNFGWLPGQKAEAMHHIAGVVRGDDGKGDLAQQFDGVAYRVLFTGTDPAIPEEFRLTAAFRVAVSTGSDQEIFNAVVKVVAAYIDSLRFSQQDDAGQPIRTDFKLHNTGVTQVEYDNVHGVGQFALLSIPTLAQRNANPHISLPATNEHPQYQEPFRAIPSADDALLTDLGLWNIFANPDFPAPQAKIRAILCEEHLPQPCPDDSTLLNDAVARFKTPSLRDLGHSAPYMHNGQFDTLDDIIGFYIGSAAQARLGTLRNGAGALQGIALTQADLESLVAFLKSLNEDYQ